MAENADDPLEKVGDLAPAEGADRRQRALVWLVGTLVILAVLWALRVSASVSVPVFAAFFLALAVWPVVEMIQNRVPRWLNWLGYLAAMLIVVLALALFCLGIWYAAAQLAQGWSAYEDRFGDYWQMAVGWINDLSGEMSAIQGGEGSQSGGAGAAGGAGSPAQGSAGSKLFGGQNPMSIVSDYAFTLVTSFWRVIAILVLIFFFTLLMLNEARLWRAKLADVTNRQQTRAWLAAVMDIAQDFRWYVLVRTLMGAVTALLYGGWLWIWGVDFIIVWMLLTFLLSFIPTLGSLLSGLLPVAFALVQKDIGTAVLIGAGIVAIEQVMGNYVDPRLQGKQLSVSPLVVLVSLLIWGWIWGVAGTLLAVPMMVLVIMIAVRVPALSFVALALSGDPDRASLAERLTRKSQV